MPAYTPHDELAEGLDEPAPSNLVESKHIGLFDADADRGPLLRNEFRK